MIDMDLWINRAEQKLAKMSLRQRVAMIIAVTRYLDKMPNIIHIPDMFDSDLLDELGIEYDEGLGNK